MGKVASGTREDFPYTEVIQMQMVDEYFHPNVQWTRSTSAHVIGADEVTGVQQGNANSQAPHRNQWLYST